MPPRTNQFCEYMHVSIMKTNIHMAIFHINKLVDVRTAYTVTELQRACEAVHTESPFLLLLRLGMAGPKHLTVLSERPYALSASRWNKQFLDPRQVYSSEIQLPVSGYRLWQYIEPGKRPSVRTSGCSEMGILTMPEARGAERRSGAWCARARGSPDFRPRWMGVGDVSVFW